MLKAIHSLVRVEMDARLEQSEAIRNEIVQILSEVRDFQHHSHSELMQVPVEEIQRTLDSLVHENQATMEELQLTLDSLIREVVRVEGHTAQLQSVFEEPDALPHRRGHAEDDSASTLLIKPDSQSIRSIDLQPETIHVPTIVAKDGNFSPQGQRLG